MKNSSAPKGSAKINKLHELIFQEAYQLSKLPVFELQLLLAAAMPVFEPSVQSLTKMWKCGAKKAPPASDHEQEHQASQNEIDWETEAEEKKQRERNSESDQIIPRRPGIDLSRMISKLRSEEENARKLKLEKKVREYGRKSVEQPMYYFGTSGISTDRCAQLVKHKKNDTTPKKTLVHRRINCEMQYIAVRVVSITTKGSINLQIFVMIESETKLVAIRIFERLGSKRIAKHILDFRCKLEKLEIIREKIVLIGLKNDTAKIISKNRKIKDVSIIEPYEFMNKSIQINIDADKVKIESLLNEKLNLYNFGKFRKRTKPFLTTKQHYSKIGKNIKDSDLVTILNEFFKRECSEFRITV